MTDFADSEKRLSAALERIDYFLSRANQDGQSRVSGDAPDARLDEAEAEIARLTAENESLRASAQDGAAQDGAGAGDDALRAELDALRTARAAEMAALDDIVAGLEALVARAPRASDAPFAEDVAPGSGDVLSFSGQQGKG
ncbi:MAG: hypothetical protein Q4F71_07690 [Paracoccus sp. (in: a-proteobacteria)]|nr:hypothetical protein [Paracoccus sp. (in: a-proteobacteria)]